MSTSPVKHIDYQQIEAERASEIQRSITARLKSSRDLGSGDSLRHVVLSRIAAGDHEAAKAELERYIDGKVDFPNFQSRATRFKEHCFDIIQAIRTKREFQGLGTLPLAKQQEVYEKVLEHFEELKQNLRAIERQEKEARLEDIRSTVWVLRTAVHTSLFVITLTFLLDVRSGLANSFMVVFESGVANLSDWFFKMIGW